MWDHEPSAEELLTDRVRRGWWPTPSLLQVGPTVLGFAACLLSGDCPEIRALRTEPVPERL